MKIQRWTSFNKKVYKLKIHKRGADNMEVVFHKTPEIQSALDKISAKLTLLTGKDNMVELDSNNPNHKDWYEDEE
ncbi:hypothetical protein [Clostridium botulinum]|uniref:Uncharacterized protein n=1 Tax=Clostridium botulinum TaxID=1491 RepID=A0A9Q1UXK0_CLOBO|nr:hypothetical protein [Clostridium botulinum]AEB77359.1 hypothetical protein CbC4_4159 [Clostridium botulinum BKT015925]KEH96347.1 hypothetical protein Y848_13795 [Clostridium botulinum C/D str. Sp77]KEH96548.1 hypothetical protein Z953_p0126 [Clostridium botulinum D str. 16868]KLU74452.1 hypothetical protein CBC3_p0157 [Clostridium botulinum V891]KOA79523.1 hypothetical protein ADU77_03860 [Clostridium botulinum]